MTRAAHRITGDRRVGRNYAVDLRERYLLGDDLDVLRRQIRRNFDEERHRRGAIPSEQLLFFLDPAEESRQRGFVFPYVLDESQDVAKAGSTDMSLPRRTRPS